MLTTGTFAVGLINAVASIFGMNLDNGHEVGQPDSRKMFLVVGMTRLYFLSIFGNIGLCCIAHVAHCLDHADA